MISIARTPTDAGLPYPEWRPSQLEAIQRILGTSKRASTHALPTGSGKTGVAVAAAHELGMRTVVLTRTKILQEDQYHRELGVFSLKGMDNYDCALLLPGGDYFRSGNTKDSARYGPCHQPCFFCKFKEAGCDYYDAVREAKASQLVVTNYSYWLHANAYGKGLGQVDCLILDEAHGAAEEVLSFLTVDLRKLPGDAPKSGDVGALKSWAHTRLDRLSESPETRELRQDLLKILRYVQEDWVYHREKLHPVWMKPEQTEELLFRNIPKVILLSATVRPKTCELLGFDADEVDFHDYHSSFDVANRPVIYLPTARLHFKSSESDLRKWRDQIDRIVRKHSPERGIIHTVSYGRANDILRHCETRKQMMTHPSGGVEHALSTFGERSSEKNVLCSPILDTGHNFPDDAARWQIISKVPFTYAQDPVSKARESIPGYANYMVAQTVVQMAGRIVRSESDWGTTYIIDDAWKSFLRRCEVHFPLYFLDACKTEYTL